MQLRDSEEAGGDYGYDGEEEFHEFNLDRMETFQLRPELGKSIRA